MRAHAILVASVAALSITATLAVASAARRLRGRLYGRFATVILGVHSVVVVGLIRLADRWPFALTVAFLAAHATVYVHFGSLIRARMRPVWWRWAISRPASFFAAAVFLSLPWAVLSALTFRPWGLWVPFVAAGFGVIQSSFAREEEIDVTLDGDIVGDGTLRPHASAGPTVDRPLRIVQISDPHLGPFMSVERLARICQRAVDRRPDVILLTGDFLTMESQSSAEVLASALAPLRALEGRVFACRGNHDLEAPDVVADGLARAGVRLLVDDEAVVTTDAGTVQVLGVDFVWRARERHLADVCAKHPRRTGHLRVVLLHDPGAFRHLPEGEGDLVLSGHTHGGQLGLLSLGLSWTVVRAATEIPDHGLWARGRDRLYVHRGTGHYGFPLRVGVPAEQSVLRVHWKPLPPAP